MGSVFQMAKDYAAHTGERLAKDAGYIPAEKLGWCPGGCASSAAEIMVECAGTNIVLAAAIRGEKPDGEAVRARGKEMASAADYAAMKAYLEESCQAVCAAIESLDGADLAKELKMPWGATMPMAEVIFLPGNHMSYHDGQINYLQLLLGDKTFHWAED